MVLVKGDALSSIYGRRFPDEWPGFGPHREYPRESTGIGILLYAAFSQCSRRQVTGDNNNRHISNKSVLSWATRLARNPPNIKRNIIACEADVVTGSCSQSCVQSLTTLTGR
jgi:hypothetical protein